MFEIVFYQDRNGNEPVKRYIKELKAKKDKDSRIKSSKIQDCMRILNEHGTRAGERFVKHIEGEIWELRPLSDRVLFAAWYGKSFVLLHVFVKKTQKTPQREIDQAKRNLADMKERYRENE